MGRGKTASKAHQRASPGHWQLAGCWPPGGMWTGPGQHPMDLATLPRTTRQFLDFWLYNCMEKRCNSSHQSQCWGRFFFCVVISWVFPQSHFKWVKTEACAPPGNSSAVRMTINIREIFLIFSSVLRIIISVFFHLAHSFQHKQSPCYFKATNSTK